MSDGRRMAISMATDVTERNRIEEELKKSEEKFSFAFSASPEAISIAAIDDGTYIDVNDVFLAWTGFRRDEVGALPVCYGLRGA
jgi:PAS domain-containing protein